MEPIQKKERGDAVKNCVICGWSGEAASCPANLRLVLRTGVRATGLPLGLVPEAADAVALFSFLPRFPCSISNSRRRVFRSTLVKNCVIRGCPLLVTTLRRGSSGSILPSRVALQGGSSGSILRNGVALRGGSSGSILPSRVALYSHAHWE
jgi:hypothetical protein